MHHLYSLPGSTLGGLLKLCVHLHTSSRRKKGWGDDWTKVECQIEVKMVSRNKRAIRGQCCKRNMFRKLTGCYITGLDWGSCLSLTLPTTYSCSSSHLYDACYFLLFFADIPLLWITNSFHLSSFSHFLFVPAYKDNDILLDTDICAFELNILTTAWTAMTFGTETHVPIRINCNDFGHHLLFI